MERGRTREATVGRGWEKVTLNGEHIDTQQSEQGGVQQSAASTGSAQDHTAQPQDLPGSEK